MIQDLEMAKKETWEEKERLSAMYEDERTKNLASKVGVFCVLRMLASYTNFFYTFMYHNYVVKVWFTKKTEYNTFATYHTYTLTHAHTHMHACSNTFTPIKVQVLQWSGLNALVSILYNPPINDYLLYHTGDIGYGDGYTEEGTPGDASATGGPSE